MTLRDAIDRGGIYGRGPSCPDCPRALYEVHGDPHCPRHGEIDADRVDGWESYLDTYNEPTEGDS